MLITMVQAEARTFNFSEEFMRGNVYFANFLDAGRSYM
jgi:hypothetical protein